MLFRLHFKPYQLDRVKAWADPFAYQDSIAYQQVQSMWAIGSGGLLGASDTHIPVYVPVRESDMIFTVIGESFGFLGSSLVIFLYFYLIYQIIFATLRTNNKASVYLSITFVLVWFFKFLKISGRRLDYCL